MSKNRQQLKTGLRAILGGGLRDEPADQELAEPEHQAARSTHEEPPHAEGAAVEHVVIIHPPPAPPEPKETTVVYIRPAGDDAHEDARAAPSAPEEPARKQRKKSVPVPPPENKAKASSAVRVGTLENPYVRKRDNLPTRKVGIVLPVALAERMQIHCVKARTRPNEFVARAIEALLDDLQA